jgi:hypothetical protein
MFHVSQKPLKTDYKLHSKDKLTALIKDSGIETWNALIQFVKQLPYGRNTNRTDFGLVIIERKGTCSSKHALLKKVADLNEIQNAKLILGMYKMSQQNTPNIGNVLWENIMDYIPEAHCYLKIDHKRIDITTDHSDFDKIEPDILNELEIEPEQVAGFKVEYHKAFLKKWISENKMNREFNDIWKIREKCIESLAEKSTHSTI